MEKQNLLDTIQAEINDKRTYAWIRCRDVMCQGEGCAIKKYGYKEDAEKITPESAAAAYEELIRTARIEIMFEGAATLRRQRRFSARSLQGCAASRLKSAPTAPVISRARLKKRPSGWRSSRASW